MEPLNGQILTPDSSALSMAVGVNGIEAQDEAILALAEIMRDQLLWQLSIVGTKGFIVSHAGLGKFLIESH